MVSYSHTCYTCKFYSFPHNGFYELYIIICHFINVATRTERLEISPWSFSYDMEITGFEPRESSSRGYTVFSSVYKASLENIAGIVLIFMEPTIWTLRKVISKIIKKHGNNQWTWVLRR